MEDGVVIMDRLIHSRKFMKNPTAYSPHLKIFFRLFTPLYWAAVFAAFFLWTRDWAIVRATAARQEQLFGLFGFCAFCVMACLAYGQFKAQPVKYLKNGILMGLPILVSLFFLAVTVELSQKSWDYEQYETAFRAVAAGSNPYDSTRYLYPPFFAQIMTFVYHIGRWLFPLMGMELREASLWTFVFYIHQCAMLYSLLLAYGLSLEFADRVGLPPLKGMLVVSALFLFNVPVFRTLLYNQVNFYILASILMALLALTRSPVASGLAISVGGMIKLYPFALVAPLLAAKKWRALTGVVAGAAGIVAVQTRFFQDLTLWKQFVLFYTSFPVERESAWFRNSSPLSFLRNLTEFSGLSSSFLTPLFVIVSVIILAWYGMRFLQREQAYARAKDEPDSSTLRLFGHLLDFSVLSLLIAPSAWEHHYVIAIPLAIWAFALRRDAFRLTVTGVVLVFIMPVFNIFPFSYLRMAGLILLLILASPRKIVKTIS